MLHSNIPSTIVSIIMPAYNCEAFIAESINSVLMQSYPHWELIIIDDGSSDNTRDVVKSYLNDPRIILLENAANKGLSFTRSMGINLAKGDVIFFMDADDISSPERIERQLEVFHQDRKISVCGSWAMSFTNEDSPKNAISKPQTSDEIKAQLFFSFPFVTPTLAFKAVALKKVNANTSEAIFEMADDYILLAGLITAGQFINLNDYLLLYRIHNSEARITSEKNNIDIVRGRMIAWRQILSLLKLEASDNMLMLHDKFSYYRDRIKPEDIQYLPGYLQLLQKMQEANLQHQLFQKDLFAAEISSRVYSCLIHACVSIAQAASCYSKFGSLLLPAARLKFPLNKMRRKALRMPH